MCIRDSINAEYGKTARIQMAVWFYWFNMETPPSEQIDLSCASEEQLTTLPGIGPAKARLIHEHQPFESFSQVASIKGIGTSLSNSLQGSPAVKLTRIKKEPPSPAFDQDVQPPELSRPTVHLAQPPDRKSWIPWTLATISAAGWAQQAFVNTASGGVESKIAALMMEIESLKRGQCPDNMHNSERFALVAVIAFLIIGLLYARLFPHTRDQIVYATPAEFVEAPADEHHDPHSPDPTSDTSRESDSPLDCKMLFPPAAMVKCSSPSSKRVSVQLEASAENAEAVPIGANVSSLPAVAIVQGSEVQKV
eukprot:TRINITY_DN15802_c0_g1_i1.p1 TRINITY_DN15802_c0_g1~~TRINITY_DN15802_c0_g1_i1.p1  ORF type:complete len:308 (-),score=52.42 TRINITY_DN15802_c0_g1_i1:263-1186(-)